MVYSNPNSYGKLFIDGVRTPFLDIGEIDDSPSDGGAICNVVIPGYLPTLKLTPKAEIYDYHGDLAAIGNVQIDSVKTGLRPKTSFSLISYSKHLQRKRIVGQFSNTFTQILIGLIAAGNASAFFSSIIFRTSPEIPSVIVSRYIDFKYLKDAILEVLASTGKILTYKVPIDHSGIEIIEPGFAGLAPLPVLKIDDFYINKKVGVNNVSYSPIGVIASAVRFFGHNGRIYFKDYLGKAKNIALDPLIMRAKDGANNYPLPENADEIILIRVTTVDAGGGDNCNLGQVEVQGENFIYGGSSLPEALGGIQLPQTEAFATFTKSTAITNPGEVASIAFVTHMDNDDTEGNIIIKINNVEVLNQPITTASNDTIQEVSLAGYTGSDIPVEVIVSIPAQDPFNSVIDSQVAISCCKIMTLAGRPDNLEVGDGGLATNANIHNPSGLAVDLDNNVYISHDFLPDDPSNRIRKVRASDNIISTLVGGGGLTLPADGDYTDLPTDYNFNYIGAIAYYSNRIYFIESFPNYVISIALDGSEMQLEYADPDGELSSSFYGGIAVDSAGNIFVADEGRSVILKITAGSATVYAGILDSFNNSGDTGLATLAELSISQLPVPLAVDAQDNLYLCDGFHQSVRKITSSTGIINTIVSGDTGAYSGDYRSALDTYNIINGVGVDSQGNILLEDIDFSVIKKLKVAEGTLETIVGFVAAHNTALPGSLDGDLISDNGYFGDGYSVFMGALNLGSGGAVIEDRQGNILLVDPNNNCVRKTYCEALIADCVNIPYTQSGAEAQFSLEPLTESVTFAALAGIRNTIVAGATGSFDNTAEFTLDLSSPALAGHPLKLHLYGGVTGHENSGVSFSLIVKENAGSPTSIFSDGEPVMVGDFPTSYTPNTYIIQHSDVDPGDDIWVEIAAIDLSSYIGSSNFYIQLRVIGEVVTPGDRDTTSVVLFRTECEG